VINFGFLRGYPENSVNVQIILFKLAIGKENLFLHKKSAELLGETVVTFKFIIKNLDSLSVVLSNFIERQHESSRSMKHKHSSD